MREYVHQSGPGRKLRKYLDYGLRITGIAGYGEESEPLVVEGDVHQELQIPQTHAEIVKAVAEITEEAQKKGLLDDK